MHTKGLLHTRPLPYAVFYEYDAAARRIALMRPKLLQVVYALMRVACLADPQYVGQIRSGQVRFLLSFRHQQPVWSGLVRS